MKKIINFSFISVLILLCFCTFILIGCKEEEETTFLIDSATSVELGDSIVLSNSRDNENAIYSTPDEELIKIVGRKVYGLKIGEAKITCTIGTEYVTFSFKVTSPLIHIDLSGDNIVLVGGIINLNATLSKTLFSDKTIFDSQEMDKIKWSSSDETIAKVNSESGVVQGIKKGEVTITASLYENTSSFTLKVLDNDETYILLNCKNEIAVGEILTINPQIYNTLDKEVTIQSSDSKIAKVMDETIVGVSSGEVTITVTLKNNASISSSFTLMVEELDVSLKISGENTMMQGKFNYLVTNFKGMGKDNYASSDLIWETSDSGVALVYDGIVLGVNKGEVTITAKHKDNESITNYINITVTAYEETKEEDKDDLERVEAILSKMTLEQKLGQMFIVGFSGTTYNKEIKTAIEECHFGNIIYMGANVTNPDTITQMSNDIQTKMVEENSVPAFISTDQEGGNVARLLTGATHFVSNMATCASSNPNNSYEIGKACGEELKNYGINMDLAPVMDVNNNPENPIIGIRSYSDDPMKVALFGTKMYQGLGESGVVGCVKHFPGHGNTNTDSHTGLPVITSNKDELYQTELAPFIASIANGVGAIMTTHIIFTAIDSEYPATLSHKVLTGLLREELGYQGLIVTDGMGMAAVTKNYGSTAEVALLAVQAGVDLFTYTSNSQAKDAYNGILEAINNKTITEERINESVKRILLSKIKYGVMDDYLVEEKDITQSLETHEALNKKIAEESLTVVKGDFSIKPTEKTLFISVNSKYTLDTIDGKTIESNSMACYCATYLNSKGYDCDYYTTSNPITSKQITALNKILADYDKVVIGFSNVKTTDETISINFVNSVASTFKDKLCVVALMTPYDLLAYSSDVTNYICLYTNQNATIVALAKYFAKEIEAKGKSPIDEALFN